MEDCSTDERLQQETLCHRQWTDEYVERPETLMRQNVNSSSGFSVCWSTVDVILVTAYSYGLVKFCVTSAQYIYYSSISHIFFISATDGV